MGKGHVYGLWGTNCVAYQVVLDLQPYCNPEFPLYIMTTISRGIHMSNLVLPQCFVAVVKQAQWLLNKPIAHKGWFLPDQQGLLM